MEGKGGLVAGSHMKNEFIVIKADDIPTLVRHDSLSCGREQICKLCEDDIEITAEGDPFIACNDCGFPVCRNCYEYERREGYKCCPQCKTKYKRITGSPRVEGDDDEDGTDDIECEFNFGKMYHSASPQSQSQSPVDAPFSHYHMPNPHTPLLTYPQQDTWISPHPHAILLPSSTPYGTQNHPLLLHDSFHPRPLDPNKDLSSYGYGSVAWKERINAWKEKLQTVNLQQGNAGENLNRNDPDLPKMDEGRQPLSRKLPIPSSKINPYRLMILLRIVILGLFFHYRLLHPVLDAYGLWLTSVICELWFALSWLLDQFPKWSPVERETYLDRLALRYEKGGTVSELADIDIFVSTVDPLKEPPIITANTVLSILAVDYPVDKVACYVSDDGAAMLTFEALTETSDFARKWVPFCKKFNIEPRAPEWYFYQKIDYLKGKIQPDFVIERRAMKRAYEEFKVRINRLVKKAQKVPEEGWTMQDGTPWPGNNVRDHPGMIQVLLGHDGVDGLKCNELPRLVYVSREKRPGFDHHKKAGAMNALVRVSAIISNAPYLLNVDCDHYINNSKALREAMCFLMDPVSGKKICYVQYPQRFNGIDRSDRYSNRNVVFFDINMKGLDGIQGPIYVGTGCVFRRFALYGFDAPTEEKPPAKTCNCWPRWCCRVFCCSRENRKVNPKDKKKKLNHRGSFKQVHALESIDEGIEVITGKDDKRSSFISNTNYVKKYGQSQVFMSSTLLEYGRTQLDVNSSLLSEAIHVISCGYEDKTDWGKEVGWIYGSVTEDILTGFKMHCHGWRSVYCIPKRAAFKGSAPINLSDRLHQVLRWALGSVEIFLSKHCPIWYGYGGGLKCLERLSYINSVIYPWTSIPLIVYCTLPAICLLTNKFIIPEINNYAIFLFMALFVSIALSAILEMHWGRVPIDDWWRNEQFWVIGGVSSHFFALFQGSLKVLAGVNTNFTVTSKGADDGEFSDLYLFKWTWLIIPPTTLLLFNIIGLVVGIANAINSGYNSWGPLFGRLLFACWVILHLNPFLRGLMGKQDRLPSIVLVWSILLASVTSLMWARNNPFSSGSEIPLEECGLDCD